jgi:sulfite exporter TauE/SafE
MGFTGSLHCVGMCGPLAILVSSAQSSKFIIGRILYNLGRILTYSTLGLIIGFFGETFRVVGIQRYVSLISGGIILFIVLASLFNFGYGKNKFLFSIPNFIKKRIGFFLKKKNMATNLMLGMVNGILPCGLVYFALVSSLNMPTISESIIFMAIFGAGTFPAMFIMTISSTFIKQKLSFLSGSKVTLIAATLSLLLMVRGLGLGIPYLSPEYGDPAKKNCCTEHIKE